MLNYASATYEIRNWPLINFFEPYYHWDIDINSISITTEFTWEDQETYIPNSDFEDITQELAQFGYHTSFHDYANAEKSWKLQYKFQTNQKYNISNTTDKTQAFIVTINTIVPFAEFPTNHACSQTPRINIWPDYLFKNVVLNQKGKWNILLTKRIWLKKVQYRGLDCTFPYDTEWYIFAYYEAEILLSPNETTDFYLSYYSLDFYSNSLKPEMKNIYSVWAIEHLHPLEKMRTYIPINISWKIPDNYKLSIWSSVWNLRSTWIRRSFAWDDYKGFFQVDKNIHSTPY